MKNMQSTSYLSGGNAAYIESLYELFLKDPQAVAPYWRNYFENLVRGTGKQQTDVSHAEIRDYFVHLAKLNGSAHATVVTSEAGDIIKERKQAKVYELVNAYRSYGHHHAKLDPLNLADRLEIPDLNISHHGLSETDLDTVFYTGMVNGSKQASLQQIVELLKQTYCGSVGVEYMHITDTQQTRWIQERLEPIHSKPNFSTEQKRQILGLLTAAEGLEKYLGSKYVGQKRFSVEGAESLIPMLNEIIQRAGSTLHNAKELAIGMAHRGRLNVLINVLGKAPEELFQEFEGKKQLDKQRSGDVKYHMGFASEVKTANGSMRLALAFNPSHLEIVDPVVEGSVRARQERRNDQHRTQVLPILIHGDAAFAGQGVVMETFSLSQARGYATGGTVHIVVNNQIGFTTSNPLDARSTLYCTDVAKMVQAPVFHVNGDDPEAVLLVAQIALDYRMHFKKDVVIDLVCYRRHGHNEADEPAATQPLMYQAIKQHPTTRKIYADQLIAEKVLTEDECNKLVLKYRDALDAGRTVVPLVTQTGKGDKFTADWTPYLNQEWDVPVDTTYKLEKLQNLAHRLETLPEGFLLQPQVAKMMEERRQMTAGKIPVNWGYAETLAYGTLLVEGYPVRLSGQDSGRGTFAHRHAVLHDYQAGAICIPLQQLAPDQANFTVIDSLLSEEAVLGFEYGYATAEPHVLNIWEAQFGDFANGAQVVLDQFISSGEQKWGLLCGLTMYLPHGFEGQGPEHSSARLERYLQLCAQQNMQVCVPSTPAQTFHMIRRQALRPFRKPLIVMTPKSLLRKFAFSTLDELANGKFHPVLPEIDQLDPAEVKRVIFCSGKVYYDLLEERRAKKLNQVAIIRIEQLYPFPQAEVEKALQQYKKVKEIVWCQEEPMNQGAWTFLQNYLPGLLSKGQNLHYAGREASASPAVGYASLHNEQQVALVKQALS